MFNQRQDDMEKSPSREDMTTDSGQTPINTNGEQKESKRAIRGIRWFLVCVSIFSANLLYGLDTTIVADIQAPISDTFQNVAQLGWLGIGFTLGSTVFILPLGKAFGTFDNKWVFIACLMNFAAASALCGAAPNMDAMIVGRVWAGAGGAGMYLGTLNLSTVLSQPKEQGLYVGVTGFVYGSGCILGPVVGGLLADSAATWRWAFYLNLVIFAVASPIYFFLLPSVPRKQEMTISEKVKSMDWLGILLCATMFSCFTVAFTFGGILWDWNHGRTIALIVVFAVTAVAFAVTQYHSVLTNEDNRLFPCEFLRNPQLILLYVIMSCSGSALFISIYYIPLYYLFVDGDTGTEAAVRLLPYICFYVVSVLICGAFMAKVGYHMMWFIFSGLVLTAGGAAMYTVQAHTSNTNIAGYTVLLGLGMTCSQAPYAVGHLLVPAKREPELIQYINISQGSSQLIGLVVASAIFQGLAFNGMKNVLGPGYMDEEVRGAIAGARSAVLERVTPEVHAQAVDVIVDAISNIWLLVVAAGVLWTVCSFFLTRARFLTSKGEDSGGAGMESEG
ncbi:MFS general substrate transporter [Paraphaeosphaeria sporulosa]|uniref:MFS general substrate transporter n=1 Tax=Paraphaeosphaeria sporulosa TaxID=1460663 RepID=A0A177C3D4_9PLEO|nr:MFS general substrate transporter [Paraphaeosphaeria sporulosa]OAG01985.1 MFS general substrate transporter [Paraphaeosphaeria sporulosa]